MNKFSYTRDYIFEGDNISAIDVAFHLEELRANIMLRKEENYLGPEIVAEKNVLLRNNEFDDATINDVTREFYGIFNYIFPLLSLLIRLFIFLR